MNLYGQQQLQALMSLKWYYMEKAPPQGGVLPYMGYIGMCGPKGYGVSAVLAINGVSI